MSDIQRYLRCARSGDMLPDSCGAWCKYDEAADEIERLRELVRDTQAAVDQSMRDLWIAVREPDKSGVSVDHALGHLAMALAPLRRLG